MSFDIGKMKDFPMVEQIVNTLTARTQNKDKSFFKINTCYHLVKLASLMNLRVDAQGFGNLPVNFYGINLAPSGYGKGHSTKIIESQITHRFKKKYLEFTVPYVAERNLRDVADKRAIRKSNDPDDEYDKVCAEYKAKGSLVYTFDSGTGPAIKQYREKILLGGIGAINYECDEIGSNLAKNQEISDMYLELYDGKVKQKLIKNTKDNARSEEIDGETPTNMLMYGEPTLLFDGAGNEKLIRNLFTTGYARRCFFGYSNIDLVRREMSVAERMKQMKDKSADITLGKIAVALERLADDVNYNVTVQIPDNVLEIIVRYQMHCEIEEATFKTTDMERRAEARGRFFKTIKLAAAFTWLDSKQTMTVEHVEAAIKLAEESAAAFHAMLTRPPVYARLANYLTEVSNPMTHAELMEELPYYPRTAQQQQEMLKNAIAWGHKNNVIVKRSRTDDIEFIQAEALQETNLNELMLSHSMDYTEGYIPEHKVPFDKLAVITQHPGRQWCAHHFVDKYRKGANAIQGFNLIAIDIDGTSTIQEAETVLEEYTYHIYTSKSHMTVCDKNPNGDKHYFRIILPMSHKLKLDEDTYKEFMANVHEYLPFEADTQTGEIARKWESNKGQVFTNEGKLFDILPFIPKTKKNQERAEAFKVIEGTTGIQRWFLGKIIEEGHRNNNLFKFGAMLLDGGFDIIDAQSHVRDLNSRLPEPLDETELHKTVYVSMARHIQKKG